MRERTAAVIGLGVAGQAATQLLVDDGVTVTVYDQVRTDLPENLVDMVEGLRTVADPDLLADCLLEAAPDLIVVSPGVPEVSPVVTRTREAGVEVIGEVELAWRSAQASRSPFSNEVKEAPLWLAITGTNGKTTVVGMTESIMRAAEIDAIQTGNVGYPITRAVRENHEILAVELSSAQLALSTTVAPWASICLNVDVDHLDWHGSATAYRDAKARVYDRVHKARLYFADDPVVAAMAQEAKSSSQLVPLVFGAVEAGQMGITGGHLIDLAFLEDPADDPKERGKERGAEDVVEKIVGPPVTVDLSSIPLLRASLQTQEGQNSPLVRDALAAAALARSVGVGADAILQGLRHFQMAPHRFALIPTDDSVNWIDDSKATNIHAAAAALGGVEPGTAVWIVGGDTKGQDLTSLIEDAASIVKAAVIIGADQAPLRTIFAEVAPTLQTVAVEGKGGPQEWMGDVVRACATIASPGDTVLLAPACASWDQFPSYGVRGDLFREAVLEIVGGGR